MLDGLSSQINITAPMPSSIELSRETFRRSSNNEMSLENPPSIERVDRLNEKTESLINEILKENLLEEKERTTDNQGTSLVLQDQLNMVSEFAKKLHNELEFSTDDDSGRIVIKVINKETEEIIRQIPSDEFLRMSNSMDEVKGVLFSSQA